MNDSTIAFRAKEQLGKFLGKVLTHFSRPRQKFLADMLYGIQASGEPMMLLTSLPVNGSFESIWRIVEGYLTRWRIEETIRFVKQAYGFENVRVHSYRGIRNMASIVLATAYFASVWLGRHVKREVLAEHLTNLSQRLKEVPEFANYAIAEGLKRAFTRFGKFCRKIIDPEPDPEPSVIYQTLPGLEKFFNPDLC